MNKIVLLSFFIFAFVSLSPRASAQFIPISIPDGNFSTSGSYSTGIIGNYTNQQLGTTPWYGSGTSVLGLLLPPTDSVGSGSATISGLVSTGVLSFTDTSGSIQQTLPTTYAPNTTYQLTVDVTYSPVLGVNLITNGYAGAELTSSTGTVLASSTTPADLLSVMVLSSNEQQLVLQYTTGATIPTGGIGLVLFAKPTGLSLGSGANVSFSNLSLDAIPEPSTYALVGAGLLLLICIQRRRKSNLNFPS